MLVNSTRFVNKSFVLKNIIRTITTHRTFCYNAPLFHNFNDTINQRQSEANRSIIVQVASEKSFDDVHQYCRQFGNISHAYFYTIPKNVSFILLEFDDEHSVNETFRSSAFSEIASGIIPIKSSFMWFRNTKNKTKLQPIQSPVQLNTLEKTVEPKSAKLTDQLMKASTISDQIQLLYENTRLNDLSIRLRFLGALQIQRALSGLFLNHAVLPFGSTVNGFGKLGCDLDMILHYNTDDSTFRPPNDYNNRRLMFHTKGFASDSDTAKRVVIENHIKFFGTLCESFIPGASNVVAISRARVPIVRYFHKYLDVSVDISLLNMTGFHISELFHIFGELDERVRPLVFLARRWAQEVKLTSKTRPNSITNFQISCLVLCFLQQLPKPVLPTVSELVAKARKIDVRVTEDNRNYTFLRDINEIQFKTLNNSSLEHLFIQFLEFYGSFDFAKYLISLNARQPIRKIEPSPLQIANPFELEQNWSRNVSYEECAAFKMHTQETFAELVDVDSVQAKKGSRWGLLSIFPNLR